MKFDKNSDVIIVLTSCGRFDLLSRTLSSLNIFNTYPIKKIIITEDSSNSDVINFIPKDWLPYTEILVNKQKLGQIKSIDKAYQLVDTKYIFHCEDDWEFYRSGFIEESKLILENNDKVLQVWLRDYNDDIKINYPFHYPAERLILNDMIFYKLGSNDDKWKGFSFNPGLRRRSDYDKISCYFCENKTSAETESYLTNVYHEKGMYAVFLEKSAVKHIGWDSHVLSPEELQEKVLISNKRKKKKLKNSIIGFIIGFLFGFLFTYLV
ncbi:glycosyltransferase [Candidatus Schmidhempelia bombi]|uniref:Glycosyltransferase n=1 Tax=Candidatus Schmidhempelia bombi str. Bimp TaxID=1387197 RepID=A0AB94IC49_9GAMM|nr:glycosyltransferase [Candidatus Schmidhempelia bombi]TEA26985.1 glycosyltransferase [Candidatus Schmidhempelia bombi str. Bimp]